VAGSLRQDLAGLPHERQQEFMTLWAEKEVDLARKCRTHMDAAKGKKLAVLYDHAKTC